MLTVLFYGALRVSELCSLNTDDIDLETLTIRVREGKGRQRWHSPDESSVFRSPEKLS